MDPVVKRLNELMEPVVRRILAMGYHQFNWHCVLDTSPNYPVGIGGYVHSDRILGTVKYISGLGTSIDAAFAEFVKKVDELPLVNEAAHIALGRDLGLNPDGTLMEEYRTYGS